MKFMRRGLAILLAVLLVIPGSPVSVERVLLTEAAEADTESEVESAELEKSSMANFEADGENGGKKEQGNTDNTVNTEGRHSSEMAEEPSTVEESKESSVMVNDDMDDRAPDAVEGDVEPGEDISVEDDAEDSDLGKFGRKRDCQERSRWLHRFWKRTCQWLMRRISLPAAMT